MENNKIDTLMTIKELTDAVFGKVVGLAENLENFKFTSVAIDSRQVVPGSLFVPLIGEYQDGHKYIPEAIDKGASVIFVTKSIYDSNSRYYMDLVSNYRSAVLIAVENNMTALQDAARYYVKKFPDLIKVAITGSSGKTTTKEICKTILSQKYNVVSTIGNYNSETGLPLSVFNIRKEHQVGIFEMGMNRENEIAEIAKVFKPNYAIITNIGSAHIGILGSRENIAAEKKNIFNYIKDDGLAIIPQEDDFRDFLCEGVKGKIVFFGESVPEKESGVKQIESLGIQGTKISIDGKEAVLSLPGKHNYLNVLSCIALAKHLALSTKQIVDGVNLIVAPEGRSSTKKILTKKDSHGKEKIITVFEDCYNANPDSMENALDLCNKLKVDGKKIYILGDMFELGKNSISAHSKIGAITSMSDCEELIFIGQDMEHAAKGAKIAGKVNVKYYKDLSDSNLKNLSDFILNLLADGDFLFLKASHGMHLEKIIEQIVEKVIEEKNE